MNDDTNIELPQALLERLKEQDRSVAMLTPQTDRAVAEQARAQFAQRPSVRRRNYAPAWGLSAAAAAALVFVFFAAQEPPLPGDYDGSGSVDVLDAFALSRELTQNPQLAANDSVDSLMQRIVALDGGLQ